MTEDVIEVDPGPSQVILDINAHNSLRAPSANDRQPLQTPPQSQDNDQSWLLPPRKKPQADPDAVSIPIPGSTPRPAVTQPMGGIPKGPTPRNTLNHNPPFKPHSTTSARGGSKALRIESSTGVNVKSGATRHRSPAFTDSDRPTKRHKLGTMRSHSKEVVEIDDDSEGEDELNGTRTRINPVPSLNPLINRELPSRKQEPVPGKLQNNTSLALRGSHIDEMMDSNDYANNPPKIVENSSLVCDGTAIQSSLRKGPYRGTARGGSAPRVSRPTETRSTKVTQTGEESKHFSNNSKRDSKGNVAKNVFKNNPPRGNEPHAKTDNLQHQFKSTNGKQRGSDGALSADELASGPTEGGYTSVSRVRSQSKSLQKSSLPSRSPTPVATDTKDRRGDCLPESNIPSTKFKKTTKKRKTSDEGPWGVEVMEILSDNVCLPKPDDTADIPMNIGIVREECPKTAHREYDIHYGGTNVSKQNPHLKIDTTKLRTIVWARDCCILRLDMMRAQSKNQRIDIAFHGEADLAKFLIDIQGASAFKLIQRENDFMIKAFEKRRLELSEHVPKTANNVVDESIEMDFLTERVSRHRKYLRAGKEQELMNVKRQRTTGRLTDNLEVEQHPAARTSKDQGVHTCEAESSIPESQIDSILHGVGLGQKKAYATRSQNPSTAQRLQQREECFLDEFPEALRYSRMNDMGMPWVKSLIYPKDGKKKATVEWLDLERLDEGQFFNDNLINFYLRHLECNIEREKPNTARKIYWFNSYFFEALTKSTKGRKCNFEAVRKWTRSIDLFTYEYVIVPINEAAHWYLAIIYNLPALNRIPSELACNTPESSPVGDPYGSPEKEPITDQVVTEVDLEENHSSPLLDTIIDPYEEGTRESLAELSLDGTRKSREQTANGPGLTVPMRDIYDIEEPVSESEAQIQRETRLHFEKSEQLNSGYHSKEPQGGGKPELDPIPGSLAPLTVSSVNPLRSNKKGRRKSFPPGRTYDPNKPAIIVLDSLGGQHPSTIRFLKDYLHSEADDKRGGMMWEDTEIRGINPMTKIPQQQNFCDCGVYLLGYVEKFKDDPRAFVERLLSRSDFSSRSDFPRLIASKMRSEIRELLVELHNLQEPKEARRRAKAGIAKEETAKEQDVVLGKHDYVTQQAQHSDQVNGGIDPNTVKNTLKARELDTSIKRTPPTTEHTSPHAEDSETIEPREASRHRDPVDVYAVEDEVALEDPVDIYAVDSKVIGDSVDVYAAQDKFVVEKTPDSDGKAISRATSFIRDSFTGEDAPVVEDIKITRGFERASPIILDSQPEPTVGLAQSTAISQLEQLSQEHLCREQLSQELDEPREDVVRSRKLRTKHPLSPNRSRNGDDDHQPSKGKEQSPPKKAKVEVVIRSPALRKQTPPTRKQSPFTISDS